MFFDRSLTPAACATSSPCYLCHCNNTNIDNRKKCIENIFYSVPLNFGIHYGCLDGKIHEICKIFLF